MAVCDLGDLRLAYAESGDPAGPAVVYAHGLGGTGALWSEVMRCLPAGFRQIRYDLRGHGGSDVPAAPYSMGALVRDAERLLDALGVGDCVFVGSGLGGMVAQGLAVKRVDQIRALVLANTAVKLGTPATWAARIARVQAGGMAAETPEVMARWFGRAFRKTPAADAWRAGFEATPVQGYLGGCHAISGTDFYTPTAGLRLPCLVIAGSEDSATPADLLRETADLVHDAGFRLIRGAGHLPALETPAVFAAALAEFLDRIGHALPAGTCGCGGDHGSRDHPHGPPRHGHHGDDASCCGAG